MCIDCSSCRFICQAWCALRIEEVFVMSYPFIICVTQKKCMLNCTFYPWWMGGRRTYFVQDFFHTIFFHYASEEYLLNTKNWWSCFFQLCCHVHVMSCPLTVTFINFKKAFDSINREVMFAVLQHYGIPEPLVNSIGALYNNSKSAVMVDGNISEPFEASTGVLQGDFLAPFLFIILVDYLLKKVTSDLDLGAVTHPRCSRRYPVKVLNDLDFADDIALLESTIPRAQAQLTSTAAAAKYLGLIISVPKTEYMIVNEIVTPTQHFKSMVNPSTMWQISDTLALKWRLLQATLKGARH